MSKQEAEALTEEDTSVSEAVDTSTDDEDVDPLESLENDETSFDDVEDDDSDDGTEADESEDDETDEEETPQEQDDDSSPDEEPEETESESDEEDTPSESEDAQENDESQDTDKKSKEEQKRIAHEAYKRREAERQLREERQQREEQDLKAYLEAARDDEAELAKRQTEVERYYLNKERSAVMQDKLDAQITRAVSELGISKADAETKEYIARQLDKFEQGNIVRDQQGNVVEVKGDVYQYIKEEMDSISHFRNIGAREQTKKKAAEKTRTVAKPTRTPKEPKKDADIADFDSEFYGEDI